MSLVDQATADPPIATFPLWCDEQPPTHLEVFTKVSTTALSLDTQATRIFQMTNESRTKRDLGPLQWSPRAANVAAAYCTKMLTENFVSHRSPEGQTVVDRLLAADIQATTAQENLVFLDNATPYQFHRALMRSPTHRANILAPAVTHMGVAVVSARSAGGGETAPTGNAANAGENGARACVTQVFYRTLSRPGDGTRSAKEAQVTPLPAGRDRGRLGSPTQTRVSRSVVKPHRTSHGRWHQQTNKDQDGDKKPETPTPGQR